MPGAAGKKQQMIALDETGFGRSDKPLIDYSVQTEVAFKTSTPSTVSLNAENRAFSSPYARFPSLLSPSTETRFNSLQPLVQKRNLVSNPLHKIWF
jgi:hypothetical protein